MSFRRPNTHKSLAKDIAAQPAADKLLTWLDGVAPDSVLLLTGQPTGTKGVYVKSVPAKDNDQIVSKPSPAMKDFQQLLEGLLPVRTEASDDLWQAAQPLAALLQSEAVRQHGVRHTEALVDALKTLCQAQQALRDRQGTGLDAAPVVQPGPLPGGGSPDDGGVSFEGVPENADQNTVLDLLQVWALAPEQPRRQSLVLSSRWPVRTDNGLDNGSGRVLMRRNQSFNLNRAGVLSSSAKKGDKPG